MGEIQKIHAHGLERQIFIEKKKILIFFSLKILLGLSNPEAKKEVQLWNDMVIEYEKKTASIDPDTLTRQKSNKIFQQLMKSISDVTEGDKFIGEYMTQVCLIMVLWFTDLVAWQLLFANAIDKIGQSIQEWTK